jgi:hypothetical protein
MQIHFTAARFALSCPALPCIAESTAAKRTKVGPSQHPAKAVSTVKQPPCSILQLIRPRHLSVAPLFVERFIPTTPALLAFSNIKVVGQLRALARNIGWIV